MVIYTVRQGDSIYSIGRRLGVPPQKIIDDNLLQNPEQLAVGQVLVVAVDQIRHTVAPGESLFGIARRYGTTVAQILEANPDITNPAAIYPGQSVVVPVPDRKLGSIDVNGYAFPSISQSTLRNTLPHLTFISPFSYQVRANGSLVPLNDAVIIEAARAQRVAPLMVITNILEGGSFDSELASAVLNSEQAVSAVLDNVVQTIQSKNYTGLDIDFEYIYPSDREAYNRFVQRVVDRLHPLGYTVTTALAPKNQRRPARSALRGARLRLPRRHGGPYYSNDIRVGVYIQSAEGRGARQPCRGGFAVCGNRNPKPENPDGDTELRVQPDAAVCSGSAARTISHTAAVNLALREGARDNV